MLIPQTVVTVGDVMQYGYVYISNVCRLTEFFIIHYQRRYKSDIFISPVKEKKKKKKKKKRKKI